MIQLTIDNTQITLPDDLRWSDEFSWAPVAQTTERGATGTLFVFESVEPLGRPITLVGGDASWLSRTTLLALQATLATAGQTLILSLYGTTYRVIWRRDEAGPMTATPVLDVADPADDQPYNQLVLRFLEVE